MYFVVFGLLDSDDRRFKALLGKWALCLGLGRGLDAGGARMGRASVVSGRGTGWNRSSGVGLSLRWSGRLPPFLVNH